MPSNGRYPVGDTGGGSRPAVLPALTSNIKHYEEGVNAYKTYSQHETLFENTSFIPV